MKLSKTIFSAALTALVLSVTSSSSAEEKPMTVFTNDSAVWVPLYGEKWWDYYHADFEGFFPGGRSNLMHDKYLARVRYSKPLTVDWKIFNRHYVYDGEYFAVEWFYRATHTDDGFQQWEATLGVGRIKDGKMVVWSEFFDDNVGALQRISLMPFYKEKEALFPWPEDAILKLPYRP